MPNRRQTLRREAVKLLARELKGTNEPGSVVKLEDVVDKLFGAIEHRLPEKKNIDWEKVAEKQGIDQLKYNGVKDEGYNQALSEVKSILKGE